MVLWPRFNSNQVTFSSIFFRFLSLSLYTYFIWLFWELIFFCYQNAWSWIYFFLRPFIAFGLYCLWHYNQCGNLFAVCVAQNVSIKSLVFCYNWDYSCFVFIVILLFFALAALCIRRFPAIFLSGGGSFLAQFSCKLKRKNMDASHILRHWLSAVSSNSTRILLLLAINHTVRFLSEILSIPDTSQITKPMFTLSACSMFISYAYFMLDG